jgi:hypothetical protein
MNSANNLSDRQLNLINKVKKYLKEQNKLKFNTFDSSVCYFSTFSDLPGYAQLKLWHNFKKNFFFFLKINFKNILGTLYIKTYKIKNHQNLKKIKFKNLIITWGDKKSFDDNGSYYDKYFNVNSNDNKETLWFIIFSGKRIPKKISKNCAIFYEVKKKFSYIKIFIVLKNILSIKNLYHKQSIMTEYSYSILSEIKKILNKNFVRILMPYEGQPFQNTIFYLSKKIIKKIKTIGYVHSFPIALPLNFIFRQGSPDNLIVNGYDQYLCMNKYLGWKSNRIDILQSLRFSGLRKMNGFIYLPYQISSEKIILSSLSKIFANKKYIQYSYLKIKNHPLRTKSQIHIKLTNKIKNYLYNYDKKIIPDFSIFIGSTGSIIEALEIGSKVIHISSNPLFEIYSNKLWSNIKVKKIDEFIFEYSLIKHSQLIKFNYGKSYFKKYINL